MNTVGYILFPSPSRYAPIVEPNANPITFFIEKETAQNFIWNEATGSSCVTSSFIDTISKISPNFLLWKFFGNPQFRMIRPKLRGNFAFPQSLLTRKLVAITVFYAVWSSGTFPGALQESCSKKGKSYEKHIFWSAVSVALQVFNLWLFARNAFLTFLSTAI